MEAQSYASIQHLVVTDDGASEAYLRDVPFVRVARRRRFPGHVRWRGVRYYHAPYNLHLNALAARVGDGLLMYLDDDDELRRPDAVERIVDAFTSLDALVLWRVGLQGRLVPSDANFGGPPRIADISGIGFMFPSKYLGVARWDRWSACDYRVVRRLYHAIADKHWIDEELTGSQREDGAGLGRRDDAR